jgi:hypothetical protein
VKPHNKNGCSHIIERVGIDLYIRKLLRIQGKQSRVYRNLGVLSSYPIFRSKLVDSDEILLTTKCRLFFVCELWKNEWRGSCHCKNIRRVFAGTKFADLRKCLCYVVVGQS